MSVKLDIRDDEEFHEINSDWKNWDDEIQTGILLDKTLVQNEKMFH